MKTTSNAVCFIYGFVNENLNKEKTIFDYAQKQNLKIIRLWVNSTKPDDLNRDEDLSVMLLFAKRNNIRNIIFFSIKDLLFPEPKNVQRSMQFLIDFPSTIHFIKEKTILNSLNKIKIKFFLSMQIALANMYSKNLSEKIKRGIQRKKLKQLTKYEI